MPEIELKPLPFEEAIEAFKDLLTLTPDEFYAIADEARALAFTVSHVIQMDVLVDMHAAVEKAIAEGETLADFRDRIDDIFETRGWTAPPDFTPWRMETIFRTNVQTAYTTGRYKQMVAQKEAFPYWEYDAVNDSRTRPTHAALDGKIFPADHPFWDTWYPPNGYNCFPLGTMALIPSGWKPIESIGIQDWVIGGSGQEQRVTAVHRNRFNGNLVRLIFKDGFIDATPNHRILTMRGWMRAEELQTGDIFVQTAEDPTVDTFICDVNDPDAEGADFFMADPIQRKSAEMLALNSQVKRGNENVNPSGTDIRHNDMVKDRLQTKIIQMFKNKKFGFCRGSFACRMSRWVSANKASMGLRIFGPDRKPSRRRCFFEFLCRLHRSMIQIFCFIQPWMPSFACHCAGHSAHHFRSFHAAFGWSMEPLSADGVSPFARPDFKIRKQSPKCAIINSPPPAKLAVGKFFSQVETIEDFSDGAPLNRFDSLNNFKAWARSHCHLRILQCIEKIPYNDIVVNLSVQGDNSYIIQGATVHNCRCGVNPVSKHEAENETIETKDPTNTLIEPRDGVTGEKLPARQLIPDQGWDHNPAKQRWQPDLGKYPKELQEQFHQ